MENFGSPLYQVQHMGWCTCRECSSREIVMLVTNAFSLNMIEIGKLPTTLSVRAITREAAIALLEKHGVESAVGHDDTARLFSKELGISIPMNRSTLKMGSGSLLVGQYAGTRLPEGALQLPNGATIKWVIVEVSVFETDLRHINGG